MTTRSLACIIGWPVAHSLSPVIHNAAFEATGLAWTYMAIAVRPGAIDEGVDLLKTLGVSGGNVTAPHKTAIMPLLDAVDDEARQIGAVNTLTAGPEGLTGSNTDGRGFIRSLVADAGVDPRGLRSVVLGGGGAARAVASALASSGSTVVVTARTPGQAHAIADLHPSISAVPWDEVPRADLLVQATSAAQGLSLDGFPFDEQVLAVDLVYGRDTDFLRAARAAGARSMDGLGMLVHQAALSFERWTGQQAPLDVMREAAAGADPSRMAT